MSGATVRQSRHGASERKTRKMPFSTLLSSTRGVTRGLLGRIGWTTLHSRSVSASRMPQGPIREIGACADTPNLNREREGLELHQQQTVRGFTLKVAE